MKASTVIVLGAIAALVLSKKAESANDTALSQAADAPTAAEAPYIGIAQNVGDVNGDGVVNAADMFQVLGYQQAQGYNSRDYNTPLTEQQEFERLSEDAKGYVTGYHTVRNIPALERQRHSLLSDINSRIARANASGNGTSIRDAKAAYDSFYAPRIDAINEAIAFLQKWGEYK